MVDPIISTFGGLLVKNGCKFDIDGYSSTLIGLGIAAFHKDVKYSDCFKHPPAKPMQLSPADLFILFHSTLKGTLWMLTASHETPEMLPEQVGNYFAKFCPPEIQKEYLKLANNSELFGILEDFATFHGCPDAVDIPLYRNDETDGELMESLGLKKPMSLREYASIYFPIPATNNTSIKHD